MGRTLFWYLFRDMLRIFVMAAVVLAGIMSFGGLLRPLTQHGLDAMQVAQMWLYLMPAMMTYSLPVAAVFAASIVYGRLTADNELTACRAAGISHGSVLGPAVSLGIVASVCSLLFLSYVVPYFSYQAQRVIYANVAKVIASQIQRTHMVKTPRGAPTIYAQNAYIPPQPADGNEQIVVLTQPTIISYSRLPSDPTVQVPRVFDLAREATLFIQQDEDGQAQISAVLRDATRFTRQLGSQPTVGLEETRVGPISMPSMMEQNVKFMDINRLKALAAQPEKARQMQRVMQQYIELEQRLAFYADVERTLRQRPAEGFAIPAGEDYQVVAPSFESVRTREALVLRAKDEPIRVARRTPAGRISRLVEARELQLTAQMDRELKLVIVDMLMRDVTVRQGDEAIPRLSDRDTVTMPMPEEIAALQQRTAADYLRPDGAALKDEPKQELMRARMVAVNDITSEMHSRASFATSCLVLVLVGSVLGMLFRSGDFLSAFAVSVIPALLTITLVVSGSQTAGQVPASLKDPLWLGLGLVWSGNVVALLIALGLFLKIRRT